jgi:FecR protein
MREREMSEEYLWDRSGPPDPEIERLERTLAPLRYRHRAEAYRETPKRPRIWWAAAAAVALAAAGLSQLAAPGTRNTGWQVTSLEGAARMGDQSAAVSMQVRPGQVLRTAGGSQLSLQADDVGTIDLGPNSELRAATDRKVLLQRGMLHAFIWAPAREFVVDTPGARAVDLGCEYTLNVDDAGNGVLKVSLGWVAFQFGGHESFIPAGAECVTRKRTGPGIPYYADSPDGFREALGGFERGDGTALGRILAAATPRDGLTLWHLLTRVPERERGLVFDRFGRLVTLPPEVSRAGVLRNDPHALDLCWDALGLENTGWWRGWERRWSQ